MAPDRDRDPEAEGVEPDLHDGHGAHDPDEQPGADDLDVVDTDVVATEDETGEGSMFTDEGDAGSQSAPPGKMETWRKRSATGAMLTGLALGFQQVFEKEREDPAIIMTTSGSPPRDLPVDAEVEHGRPRRSVVNIRPWLLDRNDSRPASEAAAGAGPDPAPRAPNPEVETGAGDATDAPPGPGRGPTGSPPQGD